MPIVLAKLITATIVLMVTFVVYVYAEYLRDNKTPPRWLLTAILFCLLGSMLVATFGFQHLWFHHWYPIDTAPWNIK